MAGIIIALVGGIFLGAGLVYFLKNDGSSNSEDLNEGIKQNLTEILPVALNQASEELVRMANEKLGSESKQNRIDLENKRSEIERLVKTIQEDLKASKKDLEVSEKERINSFSALNNSLKEYKEVTAQLSVSTENLKKVLSFHKTQVQIRLF
jgi:hypothetical protein